MVTGRLAAALLRVAVRRWPAAIRDELHREWAAELHVLAEHGRPWAMLRYSGSLALARPARRPVTAGMRLRQVWHAARVVLVAPLAGIALLFASLYAMRAVVDRVPYVEGGIDPMDLQMPLVTGLCFASALLFARLGRSWGRPYRSVTLVAAVTVPPLAVLFILFVVVAKKFDTHVPGFVLFFSGLAILLAWAGHLARSGRRRSAWWLAVGGAVVVADVATIVSVVTTVDNPDVLGAPLWLFVVLTGQDLGLTPWPDMFVVTDVVELDPLFYLIFAGFALGAVLGRRRQAAGEPARGTTQELAAGGP
ncbi:hypothetical protein KZZ52_01645 [Dactylosporangium sp. AC04546]|uniref:hypothetical protein n=1 Tax=Dactylosporangium sp. AC04546 TaxID=2862460 RepID=UPI001EE06E4D|nr:hypothetical protein [Dactylosporangium sp. AC04546]WVK84168.1 hypothetical protein KZZ52_01645 [Dactylosporangium sp. AC04546]